MESITIGEIGIAITFIVGLISGGAYLKKNLKSWVQNSLQNDFNSIKEDIKSLRSHIDEVDQENCKNFLVQFLAEVDRGSYIDEVELLRFWEEYEHYTSGGGNSYIKDKVKKLQNSNKL